MPLIFLHGKSALIMMLVLGTICLVDGIAKKDTKEILVALATLGYAIVSLVTGRKKNIANNNDWENGNSNMPNNKP
ncbi:hypothetical protein [Mucilaginibacter sp.]|uniref:hypothetical protein n=1 Tax=Mucilaginibacter sp. TaxID=1882438 RepID=UPI002844B661|nr:hypothetical protein [Mucilaginibacter sp.]MDR3697870.1 hypothetical protein [Mucilaginibacter sp.]